MRISALVLAFASVFFIILTPAISNAQTSSKVKVVNLAQPSVISAVPVVNLNVAKTFMHDNLATTNSKVIVRAVNLGTPTPMASHFVNVNLKPKANLNERSAGHNK